MDLPCRRSALLVALTLSLVFMLQSLATGDVIYRKNGPPLEGKIISETATKVVLKTAFGTTEVKKSDITRIERKKTKKEEFAERLKKLKFSDVDGLKELVIWAEDNGLKAEAKKVYQRIIRLDPDDKFANRGLGRVEYKGKWYTPKELEKIKKAESASRRAEDKKGEGSKSSPPRSEDGDQGKKRPGRKVAAGDVAGMVEQKLGVRPVVVSSEHFRIVTMFEEEEAKALLELAEKVHEDYTEMIEEKEGRRYWTLTADEYLLSSRGQYLEFLDKIMPRYVNNKGAIDYWKSQKGNAINSFPPIGASVRKNIPLRNVIVHHAAKHLIRNYVGPRKPLASWLTEGFAYYMEFKFEKAARVTVRTDKQYGGDTKIANKGSDSSTWPELVKTAVIDQTYTPFDKLKHVMLNELDFEHLAKSWSLMTFLIDEHEEKFIKWVKNMRKMQWEEAMYKAYHWTNAELDKEWSLWVKAVY